MDMTWNEGLAELDAFFDANASVGANGRGADVEQASSTAGDGSVGAAVAMKEAIEEVPAIFDAELVNESSIPTTKTEDMAPGQHETLDAHPSMKNYAPAVSKEEDPQTGDHVAPLPANDATSTRLPGQPHFTDNTTAELAESDYAKREDLQDAASAPTDTRSRKDSMNISFLINEEDESQRTTTTANGVNQVPSIHPSAVADAETLSTSKTSPASTISSAASPPQFSFTETSTTPERNINRTTNETPTRPPTEMHPPSSEGKSSLIDEMHHEEEHAYFKQSGSAMRGAEKRSTPLDDDNLTPTGDEDSLADAPGSVDSRMSQIDLRERLREAAVEDEEMAVENQHGVDEGLPVDASNSIVSPTDEQDLHDDIAQDGQTAVNDADEDEDEAESGVLQYEEDAAPLERADYQSGQNVVTGIAGAAKAELRQIVLGILSDKAKNGEATESVDAADSVILPEPAPMPASQPPARIADADAGMKDARHEQQVALAADVEMSEDELASSSPQTMPRKRKSDVNGDLNPAKSARATKKAKTTNSNAVAPTADNKVTSKLKPQKKSTKAEANATTLSSKSKNPHGRTRKSTGAKELKGLTGVTYSLGGESGTDGDVGGNGGGGRKTRAQTETEKNAQPNAAGAVRQRRKGA